MPNSDLREALQSLLRQACGESFSITRLEPVHGGDINTALRIVSPSGDLFAKIRPAEDLPMFEAEAAGLTALAVCPAIKVPQVITCGRAHAYACLILEWLEIRPLREEAVAQRAGAALAELHRCQGELFGWPRDNFIGTSPQCNTQSDHWAKFFIQQRLRPQFEAAQTHGFGGTFRPFIDTIYENAPAFFLEYRPAPSLLHGDLWSGNLGATPEGMPVLYDPACYYGDRETDLAMTELFGGLPVAFYAAYRKAWPLDKAYEQRKPFYNLYHILNHLNLFGRSYLGQAERMASQLARTLRR